MTTSVRVPLDTASATLAPQLALDWSKRYALRVAVGDTLTVLATAAAAHLLVFHTANTAFHSRGVLDGAVTPLHLGLVLVVVWSLALRLVDTRAERIIGSGATEYKRLTHASIFTFGLFLLGAFFLDLDISRAYALIVFPLGTVALMLNRWLWRRWLLRRRAKGEYSSRVVLIGSRGSVLDTARDLMDRPQHGYQVVGVGLTDGPDEGVLSGTGLPIIGRIDDIPSLLDTYGADTLIATNSDRLPAERVREISWGLDPQRHKLVLAPSITDVAGSRVHLRPVNGLPLLHVETPQYEGPQRVAKRIFDVVVAALLLLALLPLLVAIAVLVKREDRGPVFYSQERVGRDGTTFRILKFRSMYMDADARRAELLEKMAGERRLFKMADDPRVTPIGRVLRRYSLDELPQLINVLRGDMSLVGPRPALPEEVSDYNSKERRRLVVTPGMSGLWQVSGRSNLGWDDGIRLDLYYADNWSMTGDLVILWRTAKAVLRPDGAY
ncbi:sugar transferase [Naasia sp. SYSU D00948]|uniref:sugar transferase n=1 Tax=Naasia sp. SYSU D00948 TaxID=2817379 RepID=UPI0027DB1DDA|nr:sugar transferase [Naasia sp. SYSU D00948]